MTVATRTGLDGGADNNGVIIGDSGSPMRATLRVDADVIETEIVTIGDDVYEVALLNDDTGDNTQGGDFNNTTDELAVDAAVVNYSSITFAIGQLLRIETEIMVVTGIFNGQVTFKRGVSGTTTATHADALDIFEDVTGIAAGSTVAVGLVATLTPTAYTAALVADINSRGTEKIVATVVTVNEVLIESADAVGGSQIGSADAIATTEGLGGTDNAFDNATMIDGAAPGGRAFSVVDHIVSAMDVALTAVRLSFPFTVAGAIVQLYDTDGLFIETFTDQIILTGNRVEFDYTGATNPAATNVARVLAWS